MTFVRQRRAVFWCLASDRIVAATLARGEREPLLEACAASYAAALPGACFAPGVLEVACVLDGLRHPHVAALAASFCRLETLEHAVPARSRWRSRRAGRQPPPPGERIGRVRGAEGLRVTADEEAVLQAAGLFRHGRLRLAALDCEPCALASLADALGATDEDTARRQALSAVAVLPEAEAAAEALGEDLAVPLGLAVAWFGAGGGRAR